MTTHLLFVHAGLGLGVGMVINGQLYRDSMAGEAGHTTFPPNGVPCSCGNFGCWERYASVQATRRYLEDYEASALPDPMSGDYVSACAARGIVGTGKRC